MYNVGQRCTYYRITNSTSPIAVCSVSSPICVSNTHLQVQASRHSSTISTTPLADVVHKYKFIELIFRALRDVGMLDVVHKYKSIELILSAPSSASQ
jgi:hypothetical protein